MARPSVDPAQVEIRLISSEDEDIGDFSCGTDDDDRDLNEYLHTDALRSQDLGVVKVYVARVDQQVVGYAAVLADMIRLATPHIKKLGLDHEDLPFIPALKVARLAVSAEFKKHYRGLGSLMMGYSFSIGTSFARRAGCRLLTVDALPKAIDFYSGLGFVKNKIKPEKDEETLAPTTPGNCVSMRFDIKTDPLPGWCLVGE